MKIKYIIILLIGFLFNSLTTSAQSWQWGQKIGNGNLSPESVAADKYGNAYLTGDFDSTLTLRSTSITSTSGSIFLIKYDRYGNVLWAKQSINKNFVIAFSVAADDSGNSYITGYNLDTMFLGHDTLSENAMFLAKYDSNGNELWTRQPPYGETAPGAEAFCVHLDGLGHEYITGQGVFLIKYDSKGNLLWSDDEIDYFNINSKATNLSTDQYGNVYMSGLFEDSLILDTYKLSAPYGFFLAKFDGNGNVLWAHQSINSNEYATDPPVFTVNKNGTVYFTCNVYDTSFFEGDTLMDDDVGHFHFFFMRFNSDGSLAWLKEDTSINGSSWICFSASVDDAGYIYISGGEGGGVHPTPSAFTLGPDTFTVSYSDSSYVSSFLIKMDSLGNIRCGSTLLTSENSILLPNEMSNDETGNYVYLLGLYNNVMGIGSDSLPRNANINIWDTYFGRWEACDIPAGINKINVAQSSYQLQIYPNPTTGKVFVNINQIIPRITNYNLEVVDELGNVIYVNPSLSSSCELDLSKLPDAVYFISVTNDLNRTVVPIVKVTN